MYNSMEKIELNHTMSLKELRCIVENLTPLSLPAYKCHILEIHYNRKSDTQTKTEYQNSMPILPFARSDSFNAQIMSWRRLTGSIDPGKCKNVYEVTFDVKDSKFRFKAQVQSYGVADTIGLLPENSDTDLNTIINHLDLESVADSPYMLCVASGQKGRIATHIPVKSTLRHVLKHCVELRGVLKKLFLLALSQYTQNEAERQQLQYLCSSEGITAYREFILNQSFSIMDVFKSFPSCKPPIQVLLTHLPRLLPRPYSIVNSGLVENNVLKICFSVLPRNRGVATGWLEDIILQDENNDFEKKLKSLTLDNRIENSIRIAKSKVDIYLRTNNAQFSLPESTNALIFIAIGTAVSPFIGFLEEIEYKSTKRDVWLFFGCRDQKLDYIYEKELNGFLERGVLTKLNTAFSCQNNSEEKHVQDSLKKKSKEVASFIKSGASIFICGDLATFANSVKLTLQNCLVENGVSEDDAADIIRDMEKEKRYVIDSWA